MNPVLKKTLHAANAAAVGLYRRSGGRIVGKARGTDVLLLTVAQIPVLRSVRGESRTDDSHRRAHPAPVKPKTRRLSPAKATVKGPT
jgi:hypothetical protein